MNIRNKFASVAATVAVTTTLAMTVVPILLTSTTTVVQSAWAQEIPGTNIDIDSLIEQYDIIDETRITDTGQQDIIRAIDGQSIYGTIPRE